MMIPTEPIGSISRSLRSIEAIARIGDGALRVLEAAECLPIEPVGTALAMNHLGGVL
jgi:hypothetical protein